MSAAAGAGIILRPVQERAIDAVRMSMRRVRRVLLCAPTGFGKTAAASELIRRSVSRGRRVLFIVHRREIVRDTARRLAAIGVATAVVMADEPAPANEPVLVCSIQTLHARKHRPPADLIIWDECHHCAARTYREIASHYPDAYHLGLTATPERADGTGLSDMFDKLVVGATTAELVNAGLLAPCDVVGSATREKSLADDPLAAWQRHAAGRRTIVFATNVAHGESIRDAFVAAGIPTGFVCGATPMRERDATLDQFARGDVLVLVNVYVLTEGFDAPATEVCLLARGCGSAATFLQMVGRVLRTAPGKTRALLIDLCGSYVQHGLPTDEREFSLEGKPISTKLPPLAIRQCPECAAAFRPTAPPAMCPACGYEFPPAEAPAVEIRSLVRAAPGAGASIDQQRAAWAAICRTGAARGYKPGWAAHQFKARFGFWPPRSFPRAA